MVVQADYLMVRECFLFEFDSFDLTSTQQPLATMGQSFSFSHAEDRTTDQRLPPSPSTYAKFLASQRLSRLPPDSRAQFSHEHHKHLGPNDGVYDCPQISDRIEDRMGHCFTVKGEEGVLDLRDTSIADGKENNEVLRFGTRDNSERLLLGEEPLIFTKGDLFGIIVSIGIVLILVLVALGFRWVHYKGINLRADGRFQRDVDVGARGYKNEVGEIVVNVVFPRRGRAPSLVKVRRGGFVDVLPEGIRAELIREASASRDRNTSRDANENEPVEERFCRTRGEYVATQPVDDWHSPFWDDDDEDGFVDVALTTARNWFSDFHGDFIMLGT